MATLARSVHESPRRPVAGQRRTVCIEHQSSSPFVVTHNADGTITWEPKNSPGLRSTIKQHLAHSAGPIMEVAGVAGLAVASVVGVFSTATQINQAYERNEVLTARQLSRNVALTVSSTLAGLLTGTVLGPVHAAGSLLGYTMSTLACPAALAMLAHVGMSTARRHLGGAGSLIRKLQSTEEDVVLAALKQLLALVVRSQRLRREFHRYAGVELLAKMLAERLQAAVDADAAGAGGMRHEALALLAQALRELCQRDSECRDSLIAVGAVNTLVAILREAPGLEDRLPPCAAAAAAATTASAAAPPSAVAAAAAHALATLALLAPHPLAQEAVLMAPGGVAALVGSLRRATARGGASGSAEAGHCIAVLQAVCLEPAGKEAVGEVGGVEALLAAAVQAAPRSQVQVEAVPALHAALRGVPANAERLADVAGAAGALQGLLQGLGPHWVPCKADLHALLNTLARTPGAPCHTPAPAPASATAARSPSPPSLLARAAGRSPQRVSARRSTAATAAAAMLCSAFRRPVAAKVVKATPKAAIGAPVQAAGAAPAPAPPPAAPAAAANKSAEADDVEQGGEEEAVAAEQQARVLAALAAQQQQHLADIRGIVLMGGVLSLDNSDDDEEEGEGGLGGDAVRVELPSEEGAAEVEEAAAPDAGAAAGKAGPAAALQPDPTAAAWPAQQQPGGSPSLGTPELGTSPPTSAAGAPPAAAKPSASPAGKGKVLMASSGGGSGSWVSWYRGSNATAGVAATEAAAAAAAAAGPPAAAAAAPAPAEQPGLV